MTFLKNKTPTRKCFNATGAADLAAQNFICDKIVLSMQDLLRLVMRKIQISLTGSGKKCLIGVDHVMAAILNL